MVGPVTLHLFSLSLVALQELLGKEHVDTREAQTNGSLGALGGSLLRGSL